MSDRSSSRKNVWSVSSRKNRKTGKKKMSRANKAHRKSNTIIMKIEELRDKAGRIITVLREVIALPHRLSAAVGILTIVSVLREAMTERTIDLKRVEITRTLCRRVPSRTLRSIGTKRNAGSVRRKISALKRI